MSFNKELKDQRRLEKDKKNLEKLHQLLSDRQQRANETNALKSTGPRTEEGKQRIRLNGLRHGLTGQVTVMTDDNRREHDDFCNPILARLNPDGPLELQIANLITHDTGASTASIPAPPRPTSRSAKQPPLCAAPKRSCSSPTPQAPFAASKKHGRAPPPPRRTQSPARNRSRRGQLLHQLAESKRETFDPAQNGFAFSAIELNFLVDRNRQLKEARQLSRRAMPTWGTLC